MIVVWVAVADDGGDDDCVFDGGDAVVDGAIFMGRLLLEGRDRG